MILKPNSSELNELSIESLLQKNITGEKVEIDLRDIEFVIPYGMITLIIFLKNLKKKSIKPKILLPLSSDVLNYLERMLFFDQIAELAILDKDITYLKNNVRGPSSSFKEITAITEDKGITNIVSDMVDNLINHYKFDQKKINKFGEVMIETFQNVPEHSNPGIMTYDGIASVQIYKEHFCFAIGDSGIGVRNSLSLNKRYKKLCMTDCEAIKKILFESCSRFDSPGRGGGLKRVRDITKEMDGRIIVRSGRGRGYIGRKINKFAEGAYLSGTQIGIRVPKQNFLK